MKVRGRKKKGSPSNRQEQRNENRSGPQPPLLPLKPPEIHPHAARLWLFGTVHKFWSMQVQQLPVGVHSFARSPNAPVADAYIPPWSPKPSNLLLHEANHPASIFSLYD